MRNRKLGGGVGNGVRVLVRILFRKVLVKDATFKSKHPEKRLR